MKLAIGIGIAQIARMIAAFTVVHVLRDFNFKDIAWQYRLNRSGSVLSQSEEQMLIDIMNDHGLEQLVDFPTQQKNTLDLILRLGARKTGLSPPVFLY